MQSINLWSDEQVSFDETNNNGRTVSGYAAVFYNAKEQGTEYSPQEKMKFRIHPGAFDKAMKSGNEVYALWGHDWNDPIGNSTSNLKLAIDHKGLRFSLDLPNTTRGNDVLTLVKDRIVKGMSFTASRGYDKWTDEGDDKVLTFYRWDNLAEITITSQPAFKGTSVFSQLNAEAIRAFEKERRIEFARSLK